MSFTNEERQDFLNKLQSSNSVELNDWEADFVANCATQSWKYSERQGEAIDKLIRKYRDTIKW